MPFLDAVIGLFKEIFAYLGKVSPTFFDRKEEVIKQEKAQIDKEIDKWVDS